MCRNEFITSGIRCQGMDYARSADNSRGSTEHKAVPSLRLNTGRVVAGIGFRPW
jgi:hypothetical protein